MVFGARNAHIRIVYAMFHGAQQQACVNNEGSSITSVEHGLTNQQKTVPAGHMIGVIRLKTTSRKKALANSVDPYEAKASEDKKDIVFHFIGRLL
ncbi:hypothetical protein DPMN_151472 [Dreissena polymorpha]|uniref:Uncharacterized protein n=1 Tax=Dreissena polymorpha TaxID=45954 RepID=A0A9D4J6Z9_DREPO|nr:hypothetical protein DPMN_151472 [Dreissena polymorpha]